MEPPAKPRKPRRTRASQSPTNDQETPETVENHEGGAPEASKPAVKPRSRPRKPSEPVETSDIDLTPVMSSPPLAILMQAAPPGKAPESVAAESVPDSEPAVSPAAVPITRATAIEKPAQAPARNPLMGVLRILAVRNIEITRRYTGRAGHSSQQFVQSVSKRVSSAQIGGKSLGETVRETGERLRVAPGNLLTGLQRQLEVSDAAVIGFTLFLIAACILLTLFGVYLWNRF